jgi:hypothetical protein
MDTSLIENVRRFNRTVTERVGALQDRFLGRDHPIGQARILWEIAGGAELAERRALAAGCDRVQLETNRNVGEAIALRSIARPATARCPPSTTSRTPTTGSRRSGPCRPESASGAPYAFVSPKSTVMPSRWRRFLNSPLLTAFT